MIMFLLNNMFRTVVKSFPRIGNKLALDSSEKARVAAESKARHLIKTKFQPIIDRKTEIGIHYTHFATTDYPDLWDDNIAYNTIRLLKKEGFKAEYKFYEHSETEDWYLEGGSLDDGNGDVIIFVDWRTPTL